MININDVTVIFNYHKEENQLHFVMDKWSKSDKEKRLKFIVCDTGPDTDRINIEKLFKYGFRTKVICLNEYKPYNQPLGKNSSMRECDTKWAFITDPDRFLPEQSLNKIQFVDLNEDTAYDLDDYHYDERNDGILAKFWHPNTFLLTKEYYEKVGGYNELFCGHYGHDDTEFRERLRVNRISSYTFHYHLPDDRIRDSSRNSGLIKLGVSRPFLKNSGSYTLLGKNYE